MFLPVELGRARAFKQASEGKPFYYKLYYWLGRALGLPEFRLLLVRAKVTRKHKRLTALKEQDEPGCTSLERLVSISILLDSFDLFVS